MEKMKSATHLNPLVRLIIQFALPEGRLFPGRVGCASTLVDREAIDPITFGVWCSLSCFHSAVSTFASVPGVMSEEGDDVTPSFCPRRRMKVFFRK